MLKSAMSSLRVTRNDIARVANRKGGEEIKIAEIGHYVAALIKQLKDASPDRICDVCKGVEFDTCEECEGRGWQVKGP